MGCPSLGSWAHSHGGGLGPCPRARRALRRRRQQVMGPRERGNAPSCPQPRGFGRATLGIRGRETPRSRPRPRGPACVRSRVVSRAKFACWSRRSQSSGGTEVLSQTLFPPAPSGALLPVCARRGAGSTESQSRDTQKRRFWFPHKTPVPWSARARFPPGRRVCSAASAGGSFAESLFLRPRTGPGVPLFLGSAEEPQPPPTNSAPFLHCADTDTPSAPNPHRADWWTALEHACTLRGRDCRPVTGCAHRAESLQNAHRRGGRGRPAGPSSA